VCKGAAGEAVRPAPVTGRANGNERKKKKKNDEGDFAGSHDKFEAIKNAAEKGLSDLKQPGMITFIGNNTATKEEIYKTLFG